VCDSADAAYNGITQKANQDIVLPGGMGVTGIGGNLGLPSSSQLSRPGVGTQKVYNKTISNPTQIQIHEHTSPFETNAKNNIQNIFEGAFK